MERIGRIATVCSRVGEWCDDLHELDGGTGPTVSDQDRQRIGIRRTVMDEVDRQAVDVGDELVEAVQAAFPFTPVVAMPPVIGQISCIGEWHPLAPVVDRLGFWPAGRVESLVEISDRRVGDVDHERVEREGPDHRQSLPQAGADDRRSPPNIASMYVPAHFAMGTEDAWSTVSRIGSGHLITVDHGVAHATLLPLCVRGHGADRSIVAHFARGNPQWRSIVDDQPALIVVSGPEAYVSPRWYPSKAEHGRVVPTWNYVEVQIRGCVRLVHDGDALHEIVSSLTDHFEAGAETPWRVDDAPSDFVESQLKAIVGVEFSVDEITGKAKLSQNRSEPDRLGARTGLASTGAEGPAIAALMGDA